MWRPSITVAVLALACAASPSAQSLGVGRTPTADELRAVGSAIGPTGEGLPPGSGSVADGRAVFAEHCARCHGPAGEGGVGARLVGGQGTLATPKPVKTVGSFWPYATTLWDYVNRAMPFDRPGTLDASQVYAVSAFILHLNGIVDERATLDAATLPKVRMPNRDGFIKDARPDVAPAAERRR